MTNRYYMGALCLNPLDKYFKKTCCIYPFLDLKEITEQNNLKRLYKKLKKKKTDTSFIAVCHQRRIFIAVHHSEINVLYKVDEQQLNY